MENKPHLDSHDAPVVSAEPKLPWDRPIFKEADIAGITQSVGLGNNDGAASHT